MRFFKSKSGSKYKAKKVTIDGITFDSKAESEYYLLLKLMQKSGQIKSFELQPKFVLQEGFRRKYDNKAIRAITYTADFKLIHRDGKVEIVDVKGLMTQQGKMRIKMFEFKYPDMRLKILKFSKKNGFEEVY